MTEIGKYAGEKYAAEKYAAEKYAEEGVRIMMEHGWLEKPPQTVDR